MKNTMKFRWLILVIVLSILLFAAPVDAATTITQSGCSGNPALDNLKPDLNVVRIEEGVDVDAPAGTTGAVTYTFGDFELTAHYVNGEWMSFDWTSTSPVGAILVKGAQCWWVYEMTGSDQYGGMNLHTPCQYKDAANVWHIDWICTPPSAPGRIHEVSHADFGFVVPEFPTLALPVGMMIGIVGLVYVVKKRNN